MSWGQEDNGDPINIPTSIAIMPQMTDSEGKIRELAWFSSSPLGTPNTDSSVRCYMHIHSTCPRAARRSLMFSRIEANNAHTPTMDLLSIYSLYSKVDTNKSF
jgi:hypothetical protein